MKLSLLTLACLAAYSMSAQTGSGNVIKVHVVSTNTRSPIAGANVVLNSPEDGTLWGRTNSEGDFTGQIQSFGGHLLTITSKGYRMTGGTMGKRIEVKAGEEADITVELLPLGVLAGRVLDQYGDPVRHASVRTEDRTNSPGRDEFFASYSATTTDDLGEYRLAEVQPGKHYVAVEYNSADEARTAGGKSSYRWPQTGGFVLYPDVASIGQAQQLEVGAGQTLRVNDIRLKIQPAITVAGTVKPHASDEGSSLSLERVDKLALHSSPMVQGVNSSADGTFKITVLPGNYVLTASDRKSGKISSPLTLEVRDKDISGLELNLTSGYEINGRIAIDRPGSIDYSALSLDLGGTPMNVDSSGAFRTNLFGGRAIYNLQGLTGDWYVTKVQVAGKQITGRQFEIEPGSTEMIFTLSPHGARVSFTVNAGPGDLPAMMVIMVPETGETSDIEAIPHAQRDASGSLIARGVPPGSYRIFSLDASDWALAMRPDMLLEKYRSLAPLISVTAGEKKNVVLPVMKLQLE